jgi:hypothetical protein
MVNYWATGPDGASIKWSTGAESEPGDPAVTARGYTFDRPFPKSVDFSVEHLRDKLTKIDPGVVVRRGDSEGQVVVEGTESGPQWSTESSSSDQSGGASTTVLGSIGPKAVGAVVVLVALALAAIGGDT